MIQASFQWSLCMIMQEIVCMVFLWTHIVPQPSDIDSASYRRQCGVPMTHACELFIPVCRNISSQVDNCADLPSVPIPGECSEMPKLIQSFVTWLSIFWQQGGLASIFYFDLKAWYWSFKSHNPDRPSHWTENVHLLPGTELTTLVSN